METPKVGGTWFLVARGANLVIKWSELSTYPPPITGKGEGSRLNQLPMLNERITHG